VDEALPLGDTALQPHGPCPMGGQPFEGDPKGGQISCSPGSDPEGKQAGPPDAECGPDSWSTSSKWFWWSLLFGFPDPNMEHQYLGFKVQCSTV
jgi:hypothetical protein